MEHQPPIETAPPEELDIDSWDEMPTAAAFLTFELIPIPETRTDITPETLAEATERVESFLDDTEPLFAASHEAWDIVKAVQDGTYEAKEEYVLSTIANAHTHRKYTLRRVRRDVERAHDSRTNTMLGSINNHAMANSFGSIQPQLQSINTIDGRRQQLEAIIEQYKQVTIDQFKKDNQAIPEVLQDRVMHLAEAYIRAHYADYEIMRKTEGFLNQGIVIIPFIDRIRDLSTLGQKGIVEFPGMLETLAAYHKMAGERSPLSVNIHRIIGRPKDYAAEFMGIALDEKSDHTMRSRKELAAALGFIRLIGNKIFENQDELVEKLAPYWQEWPTIAITALQVYTDGKVQTTRSALNKSLEPFIRKGRLPATGNKVAVNASKGTTRQAKGNGSKQGKHGKILTTASKNQDMTDLTTPEVVREPITKFGWLVNTGTTTKQNVFSVKIMKGDDAIGELLQTKHVRDFLNKYQHQVSEDTLRDVLTLIASHPNPIKAEFSDRWKGVPYYLEQPHAEGDEDAKAQRRYLHRASLRDTPGTTRNDTTVRTRLAYDIVNIRGELAVIMYGIFLKQDIERLAVLPMR